MAYSFVELVDTAGDGGGSAASKTSSSFTAAAGDTIVIWYSYGNGSSLTATAAGGGNSWTEATDAALFNGTAGAGVRVFYVLSAAAGTYSVTVTPGSSATWQQIAVLRYTGLSAYQSGITNYQNIGSTTTDALTSTNVTPSSQPAALVGVSYNWSAAVATAPTAGTGFTNRGTTADQGGATDCGRFEDKRLTTTSSVATTATATDTFEHFTTALVFTESGGGGGATRQLLTMTSNQAGF